MTETVETPEVQAQVAEPTPTPVIAEPAVPEDFETEWDDGKKYKLPVAFKELIDNRHNLHRDYTQKTQRLADERREAEDALRAKADWLDLREKHAERFSRAEAIKDRLKRDYGIGTDNPINFTAWLADPDEGKRTSARQHQAIRDELERDLRGLQEEIQKHVTDENSRKERERRERVLKAQEEIKKHVPKWDKDLAVKATKFGSETLGLPMEMLNQFNEHPGAIRALVGFMAQLDALNQAKPENLPQTPATPVSKVKGSAPAAKDPDQMSTDEWMKWRYGDIGKKQSQGLNVR